MGAGVKCYWLEPTGEEPFHAGRECRSCGRWTWAPITTTTSADAEWPEPAAGDWPTSCANCGDRLDETSEESRRHARMYRRTDTGEEGEIGDFGPGAMWDAHWMSARGPDGRCLVVRLPNGHDWMIDVEASNCTRKGEDHDCWCRHGEPPNLTVDKTPEPGRSTCQAGGGSIQSGDWHGFLRNGELVV